MNDINSLSHTKWNCKYHIVLVGGEESYFIFCSNLLNSCVEKNSPSVISSPSRLANCITIYPNTDKLEVYTMEYGYIRVSTKEQNEQGQLIAMREFGIAENRVYMDKQSWKDFERKNYKRLIRKSKKDDTLVVKSIDRLGRMRICLLFAKSCLF